MELRQLRYFAVLADALHFGQAATELHISQPGLSQQIRRLEEDLGVVLFERGRNTLLTPAGAALAEAAGPLLDHAERVRNAVRRATGEAAQTLKIVLTRSAPTRLTHGLLESFRSRHPGTEIQTETGWTELNLNMLRSGGADAVLVQLPLFNEDGLEVVELSRAPLSVILPSEHPLARQSNVTLADLQGVPYVGWPRDQAPGAWDRLISAVWGRTPPRPARVEPDLERMIAAVRDGHGFAMATRDRAHQLRREGVIVREFPEPAPDYIFGLCWSNDNTNPALHALIAGLRERPS